MILHGRLHSKPKSLDKNRPIPITYPLRKPMEFVLFKLKRMRLVKSEIWDMDNSTIEICPDQLESGDAKKMCVHELVLWILPADLLRPDAIDRAGAV